ncbi:MAG: glycosyltransferase family 4 protein [Kineosporiaceae bacterium]
MRISVVGPTHPYKGGVAAHTTRIAIALARAGHDVDLVSWSRLYPAALYPGEQSVPGGEPEVEYERTSRRLRWDRPSSWWRTGRTVRAVDLLVVTVVVPAQVPALLVLLRAARRGGGGPRVVVVAHNVVPHETHPGDTWLVARLLRSADAVLVHSAAMALEARELGARAVWVADLPPHLPGGHPTPERRAELVAARRERRRREPGVVRVLFLGMIRRYKGVDLLLEAARDVPGVHVTVAGEHWGQAGERVAGLEADPALAGRVRRLVGYVPAADVPALLAGHDVLALPYRQATASQNVMLAFASGLPVLASSVGTFPAQVRDGVDGVLVEPGDVGALATGLRRLTDPAELARLEDGVPDVDVRTPWLEYATALTTAGRPGNARDADGVGPGTFDPGPVGSPS